MEALKNMILEKGTVLENRILKVDSFLNHQIDTKLIQQVGEEFARRFHDVPIDRIVTIESSGIALAYATALALGGKPVVFARKGSSRLTVEDRYHASIYSYTKEQTYDVSISKVFLPQNSSILVIDDFLASGEATIGLASLISEARCHITGIGIAIEKSFQPGRNRLEALGYRVESLARIAKFENNRPIFKE